jgi:hypothetical protein
VKYNIVAQFDDLLFIQRKIICLCIFEQKQPFIAEQTTTLQVAKLFTDKINIKITQT